MMTDLCCFDLCPKALILTPSLSSTPAPYISDPTTLATPQALKSVKMVTKGRDALDGRELALSHSSKETMTLRVYIRFLISSADAPRQGPSGIRLHPLMCLATESRSVSFVWSS